MPLPKLVYFAARGRAEVIRLVLAEAGVAYDEENFKGPEAFGALKASGRLPYLAVPIWEEGELRLAQSGAIALHLARSHGLYGQTEPERALIDELLGAVEDVRGEFRKLPAAEAGKRAEIRAELLHTALPRWFGLLEKRLGQNLDAAGYAVGKALSVADLALWYALEVGVDNGFGTALSDCPKLRAFQERLARRPRLAGYLASAKRPALQLLPS